MTTTLFSVLRSFCSQTPQASNRNNSVEESALPRTFDLILLLFDEPNKTSAKIMGDEKETSYKMEMLPCGTGSDRSMTGHAHELAEESFRPRKP
jgi:hypothetical protein